MYLKNSTLCFVVKNVKISLLSINIENKHCFVELLSKKRLKRGNKGPREQVKCIYGYALLKKMALSLYKKKPADIRTSYFWATRIK